MPSERVVLHGSNRLPIPNSAVVGTPDPNELVTVTLMLRRRTDELPRPGTQRVTREEFADLIEI